MERIKVGVVQMTSRADVNENVQKAVHLVHQAAEDGAKLVVLPECFAYLGPEAGKLDMAESLDEGGPVLSACQDAARKSGSELILGGFWERGDKPSHVRNACIHLNAEGDIKSVYRKIHLFDVDLPDGTRLLESETVEPGANTVVAETCAGPVGLSVCYDVRFPELYRQLVDKGAKLIAVPAAFTLMTGKDHWHVLLRARAIESQCYVLAAAQAGHHYGKRVSYGHALIADPWGTVLAEVGEGEGTAVAAVDFDVIERVRTSLPSLAHRRL